MKKITKLFLITSIFIFGLLLIGISISSNSAASCSSTPKPSSSPVNWIYDDTATRISVTDVNITRSDCGIIVTGKIHNISPDTTLLATALKLHLYGKNSQLLGVLNVDPEGILMDEQQKASFVRIEEAILKPNQTTHFVVKYDDPETASNLDHVYADFYDEGCGSVVLNNMGCFGQTVNVTKIDPQTNLPAN